MEISCLEGTSGCEGSGVEVEYGPFFVVRSDVSDVADESCCCPSLLLLCEVGSSKFGAGELSGGSAEDEEDRSAALATVLLLPVLKNNVHVDAAVAEEAMAKVLLAPRWKKSRLLPVG